MSAIFEKVCRGALDFIVQTIWFYRGLIENPRRDSSFISHFEPRTWSISTPFPNIVGAMTDFGREDYTIACPMLFCLTSDKTITLRNECR